jgi:probable F420-dependent oxidoreductase
MRFGALLTQRPNAIVWTEGVRQAERLGYDVVLCGDHLGPALVPREQGFTPIPALVAAALMAPGLRVGTLVIDNDFRHPAMLAKEVATADQVTGGRFELGIGAGWKTSDYELAGIPFDPPSVRTDRLIESVHVLKGLFSGSPVEFKGEHYRLNGLEGTPPPIQQPHPPILIAGGGRRLLTFGAREADILAVNIRHRAGIVGTGPELMLEMLVERLQWVRDAAGARLPEIELQLLIKAVVITDDRSTAAAQVGARFQLSPDEALASPYMLIGSVPELCDQLMDTRERFGFSYFAVFQNDMQAFAPVLQRLKGG